MTQEGFKRKLTAILSADAVGYSRLMREDEAATVPIAAHRVLINPYCQSWYYMLYGASLRFAGRYQEAIEAHKKQLELAQKEKSNLFFPHSGLASAYALIGQEEKAQAHTKEALRIFPNASLEYARKITRFKNPEHLESYLNLLRKAGFPEHPPSQ